MAQSAPNHVAIFVADPSDLSNSSLGKSLGGYARLDLPPLIYHSSRGTEQPKGEALILQPTDGQCRVVVEYSDSRRAIEPEPDNRWHHVAFASEDLEADAQGLEQWGWVREMWSEGPDGAVSTFVYMRSPSGLRLELNDPTDAMHDKYIATQMEAAVARVAACSAGGGGVLASGSRVHHIAAVLDDPQPDLRALHDVLGIEWVEVETELSGDDSTSPQWAAMWASTDDPSVVFIGSRGLPSVMRPAGRGWSHVGLISTDVGADLARLRSIGYEELGRWSDGPHEMKDGVLLSAPEGTRILLVAS